MVPVAWRMIVEAKGRFAITAIGIGFTVMLMLFLLAVYEGVKSGAKTYVLQIPAQVWVSQRNSTNLIKTSSFVPVPIGDRLRQVPGVQSVNGILRTIAPAEFDSETVTLFIFGFDIQTQIGAPKIISGTANLRNGEIILDNAFAATHNLELGESLQIQGRSFRVAGISEGTNLIVGQFAFATLNDVSELLGLSEVRSFFLLQLEPENSESVLEDLRDTFPDLLFTPSAELAQNNVAEMEIGVLPILWTIVIFGSITGATVIVLMMYTAVLEKREDYAMLKAVGANQSFLVNLVLKQSIIASVAGFTLGLTVDLMLSPILSTVIPALLMVFVWQDATVVFIGSLAIGILGAWASLRTLRNIYPGEVFRA